MRERYSHISIVYHWITVIFVAGLFALGLWMDGLSYYHEWYRTAPDLHRSFGLLLAFITVLRLVALVILGKPSPLKTLTRFEHLASRCVHWVLYILLFTMFASGYLITTAKGDSIAFFAWFEIPALPWSIDNLEDYAGNVHEFAVWSLVVLASGHAGMAMFHQFIRHDGVLKRMWFK